jgi:RNA polymerase sigma-70 factor (ECF subfamily)
VHDQDLPAALAADLDGNFEHLVQTYQDRLYGFALRLAGNPQDAEEVAQDSFVRAYRALATYSGERRRTLAFRPWLYQIALNVFRNRVRGRHLQLVSLHQDDTGGTWEQAADDAPRPDAMLEQAELKEALDALVASLPERYRLAVVLRHGQGLGYREMAAVLKQPLGTVKANVHRGLRLLRQALETQQHVTLPRHTPRGRRGGQ